MHGPHGSGMTSPHVSVCIPTYRRPDLLQRCLESLRIQDYQDFEIIVTDDSPDMEVETVCRNSGFDKRLRYSRNARPLGSPENWNAAMRLARAPLVKMLHHDDWLAEPYSLRTLASLLDDHPAAGLAFSATRNTSSRDIPGRLHRPCVESLKMMVRDPRIILLGNFIGAPSVTIHRNQPNLEFDPRLKWLVDIDFYARVLRRYPGFAWSEQPLVCTYIAEREARVTDSCLGNPDIELRETGLIWEKFFAEDIPRALWLPALNMWSRLMAVFRVKNLVSLEQMAGCSLCPRWQFLGAFLLSLPRRLVRACRPVRLSNGRLKSAC